MKKKLKSEYNKVKEINNNLLQTKLENEDKLKKMEELKNNHNELRENYTTNRNANLDSLRTRISRIQDISNNLINLVNLRFEANNRNLNTNGNVNPNNQNINQNGYEYLLETIPSYKFSLDLVGAVVNYDICLICYVNFEIEIEINVITSCKHPFHTSCLKNWLKIKFECPSCKINLLN